MKVAQILEEKLNLSIFLRPDQIELFYNSIDKYLSSKRKSAESFEILLNETIIFLEELGFNTQEIIYIIWNHNSIIHANKKDFLAKYLLLAVLPNDERRSILINNPKYFVVGISNLYARFKYLENLSLRGDKNYFSKWHLLKMTNNEWENKFGISVQDLECLYPYDKLKIDEFLNWPQNEMIKEKISLEVRGR